MLRLLGRDSYVAIKSVCIICTIEKYTVYFLNYYSLCPELTTHPQAFCFLFLADGKKVEFFAGDPFPDQYNLGLCKSRVSRHF